VLKLTGLFLGVGCYFKYNLVGIADSHQMLRHDTEYSNSLGKQGLGRLLHDSLPLLAALGERLGIVWAFRSSIYNIA